MRQQEEVLLDWNDWGVECLSSPDPRSIYEVKATGWLKALRATADGTGIVWHVGT